MSASPPHDQHSRLALRPPPPKRAVLRATAEAYGRACRRAAEAGRAAGTTGNAIIHRRCYQALRDDFDLSANLIVRAIARAARALKGEEPLPRTGGGENEPDAQAEKRPSGGAASENAASDDTASALCVDYDARTLSLSAGPPPTASLSTVEGRLRGVAFAPKSRRAAALLAEGRVLSARLSWGSADRLFLRVRSAPEKAPDP